MPDAYYVGFSAQQKTDFTDTESPFVQITWRDAPSLPRPAIGLPPFSVVISMAYLLALLGAGLYCLLYFLLSE